MPPFPPSHFYLKSPSYLPVTSRDPKVLHFSSTSSFTIAPEVPSETHCSSAPSVPFYLLLCSTLLYSLSIYPFSSASPPHLPLLPVLSLLLYSSAPLLLFSYIPWFAINRDDCSHPLLMKVCICTITEHSTQ